MSGAAWRELSDATITWSLQAVNAMLRECHAQIATGDPASRDMIDLEMDAVSLGTCLNELKLAYDGLHAQNPAQYPNDAAALLAHCGGDAS